MTPERWQEIRGVLEKALEEAPGRRTAFLDRACASDPSLRREVEVLLASSDEVPTGFLQSSFLRSSLLSSKAADEADAGLDGFESVGGMAAGQIFAERFQLVRRLGEGGMGQVWLADQTAPVRRQDALKLIRAGMYDESVMRRFRSVRQSLAMMDHPGIAKVFDAGATPQGQPYFVMEYVSGLPITEYCDQKRLTIKERLELFIQVCEGVQHAHQKAIIHRDLKPPNILVTEVDGKAVPRIIDFGLAKTAVPKTSDETLFTRMGSLVGTPGYMSPEQADPNVQDIDTRSDVYSLGVVLYVLLAGLQPFESRQQQKQPLDELLRKLREEEPPRPSTKVSTDRDSSTETAEARGTGPKQLVKLLRADLDWITVKALEKERARRYGAPSELAADIRRYLNHEPVLARPASAAYRAGKFIRRNRLALAATAVFVLAVLAGGMTSLREAHIARIQQARAEQRFNDVRKLANSLLFEIHDSVRDLPGSTTARKLIVDRALQYLDSLSQEAADEGLQRELATAYERVGDVQGNTRLANLGDTAGAIASYRKALRIRQVLADSKEATAEDQAALSASYVSLGFSLRMTNNFPEALDAFQHAYPIAQNLAAAQRDNPQMQEGLAGVSFAMAMCLQEIGNLASSLEYFHQSAAIRERITGGSPAFQSSVQSKLAGVYGYMSGALDGQGDLDGAIAMQSKGRDVIARLLQSDPQNVTLQQFLLQGEYWIGYYLAEKGLPAQALSHYQIALDGYLKLTARDAHDSLARRYLGLCNEKIGQALVTEGKEVEGIEYERKALQISDALAAADRSDTFFKSADVAYGRSALADAYSHLAGRPGNSEAARIRNWREARSWYQKSLDLWFQLKQKAPLAHLDAAQPDKIAAALAGCDAALAKLRANP